LGSSRFPSPFIKPNVPSSGIRLSDLRAVPSTGIYPASSVHLTLSDAQKAPTLTAEFAGRDPHILPEPPLLTLDHLSGMLYPLPRRIESVHDGCRVGALPRRAFPDPYSLPRFRVGSASTLQLSGPARISYALRPARLLAHHTWTLSRGFGQLQLSNLTINYSSGSFPHW
jgi:hypothetical protein